MIISWNINAVKNKLEQPRVQAYLKNADIILLNEIKTGVHFSLPGYNCFTSGGNNTHRGGCAILVRNSLSAEIYDLDNSREDFITFGLKSLPDIQFICLYLPPSDSPYFTVDNLSRTNALVSSKPGGKFVILGDINSRFGKLRSCFLDNKVVGNHWSYEPVSHDTRQNTNAKYIVNCLAPSLVLLNDLSTE